MDMLKDWLSDTHDGRRFMQLSAVRIWSYIWKSSIPENESISGGSKTRKRKIILHPINNEDYKSASERGMMTMLVKVC